MTQSRLSMWTKRTSIDAIVKAPELKTLPPTSDTFHYHVLRAHIQAMIWASTMSPNPPNLNPLLFVWEMDPSETFLIPKISTGGAPMVPDFILKLIKCGCQSASPCKNGWGNCHSSGLGCTIFCLCTNETCCNPYTPEKSTISNDWMPKALCLKCIIDFSDFLRDYSLSKSHMDRGRDIFNFLVWHTQREGNLDFSAYVMNGPQRMERYSGRKDYISELGSNVEDFHISGHL